VNDPLQQISKIEQELMRKQAQVQAAQQQAEQVKEELKTLGWDGKEDPDEFCKRLDEEAVKAEEEAAAAMRELTERAKALGIEV